MLTLLCVQMQSNDRLDVDRNASFQFQIIKAITIAVDKFSTIFFWYLFGMCAWWFAFYKFQTSVYIYMPSDDSVYATQYEGLLIAIVLCKFLSIAYKIYFEQSVMDIFFIDWESPKVYSVCNNTKRK